MPDSSKYHEMTVAQLEKIAREAHIPGISAMKKDDLIKAIESHDRSGSRHPNM